VCLIRVQTGPSPRHLTVFAAAWAVFFAVAAGSVLRRGGPPAVAAGVAFLGAAVPLAGLARPRLLRLVYRGASVLAFPMGFAVSLVVLAAAYYLVLTPLGLALRVLGHDPLDRSFDRGAESYWTPRRDTQGKGPESYFRQY